MPHFSIAPYLELGFFLLMMSIIYLTIGLMSRVRFFFYAAAFMALCISYPVGHYMTRRADVAWAAQLTADLPRRPMGTAELSHMGSTAESGTVFESEGRGSRVYCVRYENGEIYGYLSLPRGGARGRIGGLEICEA